MLVAAVENLTKTEVVSEQERQQEVLHADLSSTLAEFKLLEEINKLNPHAFPDIDKQREVFRLRVNEGTTALQDIKLRFVPTSVGIQNSLVSVPPAKKVKASDEDVEHEHVEEEQQSEEALEDDSWKLVDNKTLMERVEKIDKLEPADENEAEIKSSKMTSEGRRVGCWLQPAIFVRATACF